MCPQQSFQLCQTPTPAALLLTMRLSGWVFGGGTSQQLSRQLNQRWEEEELRSGSEELLFDLLIYETDKSVMSEQPFSRKHESKKYTGP